MRKSVFIFTLLTLAATTVVALGDVIVKQESTASTMGMMEMEISSTEYVRADRSANEQTTLAKGGMVAMFSGEQEMKNIMINRLDKGVLWDIDVDGKTYSETQLGSYKEMMEKQAEENGDDQMKNEADKYDWTVDIKTEDDPVDINGFFCKGIIAEAKGVNREDPNEKTDLYFEYWFAKDVDGYNELVKYRENFAKTTGVDAIEAQKETGEVFSQFGDQFSQMFEKMGKADGYPIKTVITVKGSGGNIPVMGGEEIDESQMPPEMMNMMKGMMSMEKSEDGMTTLFTITNIVQSIEKKAVDDNKFEVPEGFKKN